MKRIHALLTAATLAAASAAVAQTDLWVGAQTSLMVGSPTAGGFEFLGICGGSITALAGNHNEILLGTSFGDVYRYNRVSQFFVGSFTVAGEIRSMAMDGEVLVVGTRTGAIVRVDPVSGAVLGSRQLPNAGSDANALMVHEGTLYVGSTNTSVYKAGAASGAFQLLTLCGGSVESIAFVNGELLLGTLNGRIYRINDTNGAYYGVTPVAFDVRGLEGHGPVAIVGSTDGTIRRVNPVNGQVLATFATQIPGLEDVLMHDRVACMADLNRDGRLTPSDFVEMSQAFRRGSIRADINNDGSLTPADFAAMLELYRTGCP